MSARRRRLRHKAFRLFAVTVYALLALFSWQAALIELVDAHDASAECQDGERRGGPCHCGANCHCCLTCAHAGFTALPSAAFEHLPVFLANLLELPSPFVVDRLASAERAPPAKVPKPES